MSSEYRIVFFDDREIVLALVEHARKQGAKLPPGRAVKMTVDSEKLDITLLYAKKGASPKPVEFHAAAVAQALIRHCKRQGIPLPMRAHKELRVLDGRVAFVVQLDRPATEMLIPLEYVGTSAGV